MTGIPNPKQAFGSQGPRGPRPTPSSIPKPGPRPGAGGGRGGGNRGRGPRGSGSGAGSRSTFHPANGPLGKALRVEHDSGKGKDTVTTLQQRTQEVWEPVGAQANALIVLRRLAFEPFDGGANGWEDHTPLHGWATASKLGQDGDDLLQHTLERRRAFLHRWVSVGPEGRHVRRLRLTVEWRMVSGHGLQFGVLDNGLALHGTYGWPSLPGSTLKGLAAAGARSMGADTERVVRALGGPRPSFGKGPRPTKEDHSVGSVRFLDALPDRGTVKVHSDVITPHQHPYYTGTDPRIHENAQVGQEPPFPGEHHNPVPLPFLSISGDLRVDLMGDDEGDLDAVIEWLGEAGEELGVGGRTTAGYGYFACTRVDEDEE